MKDFVSFVLSIVIHGVVGVVLFLQFSNVQYVIKGSNVSQINAIAILDRHKQKKLDQELDKLQKQEDIQKQREKEKKKEEVAEKLDKEKKLKQKIEDQKKQKVLDKKVAEQKKLEEIRRKQVEEKRKIEDRKQKELAILKKREKEKKKKEDDEKKKKLAEEKKKKEEEAKKKKLAEKKKKKEEQKKRILADKKRLKQQMTKELRDEKRKSRKERMKKAKALLKAEADREEKARDGDKNSKLRNATLLSKYSAAIKVKVTSNWVTPSSTKGQKITCVVDLNQATGGIVKSVIVKSCTGGDEVLRRSVEAAFYKSDPLPYKGFEKVFHRRINFIFNN